MQDGRGLAVSMTKTDLGDMVDPNPCITEQFCIIIYKQHIILECVKRNVICKHEEPRSHYSIIVSFNHNSQAILILHCREARGSREKHSKYVRWMDVSLTFRLEKRDHSSNCTKVSFHFIVIYWVANCMSD